jgi:hypothetical protein
VGEIEASDRFVAVNLFNRNASYHKDIQSFIADGEIGVLALSAFATLRPATCPWQGTIPKARHSTTAGCTMSMSLAGTHKANIRTAMPNHLQGRQKP